MSQQDEIKELRKLTSNLCKNITDLNNEKAKIICQLREQIINNEKLIEKNNLLIQLLEDKVRTKSH
jgi:hypothetical protein